MTNYKSQSGQVSAVLMDLYALIAKRKLINTPMLILSAQMETSMSRKQRIQKGVKTEVTQTILTLAKLTCHLHATLVVRMK